MSKNKNKNKIIEYLSFLISQTWGMLSTLVSISFIATNRPTWFFPLLEQRYTVEKEPLERRKKKKFILANSQGEYGEGFLFFF